MNKITKQQALIDVLKHDPKDKRYKPKEFENFQKIIECIRKNMQSNTNVLKEAKTIEFSKTRY